MKRNRSLGFTLIELLVVIAIIAILAAILFPVFSKAKESGRNVRCLNNLKQLNVALQSYVSDFGNKFPNCTSYCRVMDMGAGSAGTGVYMQSKLQKYLKNSGVWMCPSVNWKANLPAWPGMSYDQYTMSENGRYDVIYQRKNGVWPDITNYMWIHYAQNAENPNATGAALTDGKLVSGHSASEVLRSSKAMMFMEIPYWGTDSDTPHKIGGMGSNVAFFDGHVKSVRTTSHLFLDLSWQGWFQ